MTDAYAATMCNQKSPKKCIGVIQVRLLFTDTLALYSRFYTYPYLNHRICLMLFLPPANKVCEGYVFTGVCLSTGGMHGMGCAWQGTVHGRGACMAGGVHGRVVCMVGGICGRGPAWWGVCMAGGHAWQGDMCGGGYVWWGVQIL